MSQSHEIASAAAAQIEVHYEQRIADQTTKEAELLRWDRRLAHLRVLLFVMVLGSVLWGLSVAESRMFFSAAAVFFVVFVIAVSRHDRLWRQLREVRQLRKLARQGLARQRRQWDQLPVWEPEVPAEWEAAALDLDLFGHASVFQLVGAVGTPIGRRTLRDWMMGSPQPAEIRHRQEAVAELAAQRDLRERFQLLGSLVTASETGIERFIDWAEAEPWLLRRQWLLWTCRISPLLLAAVLLLSVMGVIPPLPGTLACTGLLMFHCLLSVFFTATVHDLFRTVSTRNGEAAKYLEMLELICSASLVAPKLAGLQAELQQSDVLARFRELRRLMVLANISHSPMMFLLVYMPLQILLLWDFHVLWRLELWQQRSRQYIRPCFATLGQFEALAGLATLADEHPSWQFPRVDEALDTVIGTGVGHPLLPQSACVRNDVEVGPVGTFLLVTGSNMSGKSTLLRSIGTNALLAMTGAPVCARGWSMPPVKIETSMRIRDSLADGVSFFMAELRRLKEIVDLAKALSDRRDCRLLFLLDEILQGTNSRERHIAVQRVVHHLLECRALGAISTHDVELAASPGLVDACRAVHFRESLDDDGAQNTMSFDYMMREGVATTTNALKLLAFVGLDE